MEAETDFLQTMKPRLLSQLIEPMLGIGRREPSVTLLGDAWHRTSPPKQR